MSHKLITAVVAALAMATLSGCGSSTETKAAPGTTASASSSAPTSSLPKAAAGAPIDGQALATAMVDAMVASRTAHLTITRDGVQAGESDIELADPANVAMRITVGTMTLETVQVGGINYLKGVPGTKKPWFKLDPKATDAFSKNMASIGDMSKNSDPRATVAMLEDLQGKGMGTDNVSGVSTEHYAFDIPTSAYSKVYGPVFLQQLQSVIKSPIAWDFWVGQGGLLVKTRAVMEISGKTQSVVTTFGDWGKPVTIVAPPAAQVGPPPSVQAPAA